MSEWVRISLDPTTTQLERFLWFAAHLDGFSAKNVERLRQQTADSVREAHGEEEWKRLGARLLNGARPLTVSAPETEKGVSKRFVSASVYDVSQTTFRGRTQSIPKESRLAAIASVAAKCGYLIKVGRFQTNKPLQVLFDRKEILVNRDYGDQIPFLASKGFFLLRQREEVLRGWRPAQDMATETALAIGAAFEVAVFMGETPAPLPQPAKDILCRNADQTMKDVHNLARRAMKHLSVHRKSLFPAA